MQDCVKRIIMDGVLTHLYLGQLTSLAFDFNINKEIPGE